MSTRGFSKDEDVCRLATDLGRLGLRLLNTNVMARMASKSKVTAPRLAPIISLGLLWLGVSVVDVIATKLFGSPSSNLHWDTEKLDRS